MIRRFRWPLVFTVIILALTGSTPSIADSRGGSVPATVHLHLPAGYVATSPISRTLDAISLFSVTQTFWFFGVFTACCLLTSILLPRRANRRKRIRVAKTVAVLVVICIGTELSVVVAPRPMAKLSVDDPDIVIVDFHSHTKASHDANRWFTAERNRAWHASGGFQLAYITDHVKWGGAIAAQPNNPVRAGDGMSLLSGVEGHYRKVSTVMLAMSAPDSVRLTQWGELKPDSAGNARQPVTIGPIPANLDSLASAIADTLPRFQGIELVDAAPSGLGQLDREETRIRDIASSAHLILVSSSNNHGWGRTVAAWNLVRIPGWRRLAPDSVGRLIEERFRQRDSGAVTIVERTRPRVHGIELPVTFPLSVLQVVGSLTLTERAVWLVWLWGIVLIVPMARHRLG